MSDSNPEEVPTPQQPVVEAPAQPVVEAAAPQVAETQPEQASSPSPSSSSSSSSSHGAVRIIKKGRKGSHQRGSGAGKKRGEPSASYRTKSSNDHSKNLESSWSFWFTAYPENKSDKANRKNQLISSFNSIESFWKTYTHIAKPSQLPEGDVSLFKGQTSPAWENFPRGGSFILRVKKGDDHILDELWEKLVLHLIGEALEEPDLVGAVLSVRTSTHRITVWTKGHRSRDHTLAVLSALFPVERFGKIVHKNHATFLHHVHDPAASAAAAPAAIVVEAPAAASAAVEAPAAASAAPEAAVVEAPAAQE